MSKVAIIGGTLRGLTAAHTILDMDQAVEVHILEESAEIGLIGEGPGLVGSWPIMPEHWLANLRSQKPLPSSSAVRRSWMMKGMAIALAERGANIHLRTRVSSSTTNEVTFSGAGYLGSGSMEMDSIIEAREPGTGEGTEWQGGVCLPEHAPSTDRMGARPDGTMEVWWDKGDPAPNIWIHRMEWFGGDPRESLALEIKEGASLATKSIETIKQADKGQEE
tara:strand:+ start:2589 stop:3251 length:663 start_codon:yes stop_codon:yes gene_type:complete